MKVVCRVVSVVERSVNSESGSLMLRALLSHLPSIRGENQPRETNDCCNYYNYYRRIVDMCRHALSDIIVGRVFQLSSDSRARQLTVRVKVNDRRITLNPLVDARGSSARGVLKGHTIPVSKSRSPCSCSVVSNPMFHFRATTAHNSPRQSVILSPMAEIKAGEKLGAKSEKLMNRCSRSKTGANDTSLEIS